MRLIISRLLTLPWLTIGCVFLLSVIGALALFSASQGSWSPWAERHIMRAAFGVVLMITILVMPIRVIFQSSYVVYAGALIILLALQAIGFGQGATRWIAIGPLNFQPSEPAKLAVVLALARYFSERTPEQLNSFLTYIPAFLIVALPTALVLIQPDLGTSLMLAMGGLIVIFCAGIPFRYVGLLFLAVMASLPVLWANLYDYQKQRILTFFNPEDDLLGAGFQITQSKIALGSGGIFGKGFLMGSQSQLNYLPEKQTDFVFTMIGEEFGLIGNLVILGIYFIIFYSILRLSWRVQHRFGRLVCAGISGMLFLYVFVNVAMVTGLVPVVGVPLPLISYGGTAMLTVFIALGLVNSMALSSDLEDEDLKL
ncbi:MAG: rod shape-determining protein RodA [Candidatus Puniceispirillaceae bacterium]